MDPILNPYSPGAGTPPPELAGRDDLLNKGRIAVERLKLGRSTKSLILVGLRGVGKTVLLDRLRENAQRAGVHTLRIEAPENRSLPAILAPQLRQTLLTLSRDDRAEETARRALRALAGFVQALRLKYGDIEVGLDFDPEPGLADNGDLEHDLQVLLESVGLAAKAADTVVVLFVDELQYVAEDQLAALIVGMHRVAQSSLPLTLFGAALPLLPGRLGRAKSYAERLFEFSAIGALDKRAARDAIEIPALKNDVTVTDDAIAEIITQTEGYPYFLQEWGKHSWDVAARSPISRKDVVAASRSATIDLDDNFFRVRFDRLTPNERRYLRGMAELGPGPHRSGDIADQLGRPVNSFGPVRAQLINKGMLWSPHHGDTAFTVPLFDAFMRRIMPGDIW
ncbi:MAG: ATP-binding protein [Candidatus Nanopelagicales bacterium]|nr:ATP-binding protein [Candidatus Nanopelagicales bacterium]MDZ4249845.1 ATP-binding protein [Candidatus Nanopelagicales bacterium]